MNPNNPQQNPEVPPSGPTPGLAPTATAPPPSPPVASPQNYAPQPQPQPPQKSGKLKKLLIIGGSVLGGLILLGVAAVVVFSLLGGGIPKYSQTQTMELAGYPSDPHPSMKFNYPVQMKQRVKTDLEAQLADFRDDDKQSQGHYGEIVANIQTISSFGSLPQSAKDEIANQFTSGKFNDEFMKEVESSDVKNVKLSNLTASDNNTKLRADLTLDIKGTNDNYVPSKGALLMFIGDKRLSVFAYYFINEVYDVNKSFIDQMEDSVQVNS